MKQPGRDFFIDRMHRRVIEAKKKLGFARDDPPERVTIYLDDVEKLLDDMLSDLDDRALDLEKT